MLACLLRGSKRSAHAPMWESPAFRREGLSGVVNGVQIFHGTSRAKQADVEERPALK
jgi:hypothetical protein